MYLRAEIPYTITIQANVITYLVGKLSEIFGVNCITKLH